MLFFNHDYLMLHKERKHNENGFPALIHMLFTFSL